MSIDKKIDDKAARQFISTVVKMYVTNKDINETAAILGTSVTSIKAILYLLQKKHPNVLH